MLDFVCLNVHEDELDLVSIDITGEVAGRWYKIEAYSMAVDQFITNHETIEKQLIKSWMALQ